ncbi:hypothetical protein AMECASPLE_029925 [Ameca splendens]|uniref:Uncharacterized protein n=1 Tax=Ameca splendens TaxID=208324 RepID=A0ABV0ZGQ1_9TELE
MGERRAPACTGLQSITETHGQTTMHPVVPTDSLERPVNLTVVFVDCGRNLEGTRTSTGKNMQTMQKEPRSGFEPRTFLLLTTLEVNSTSQDATACRTIFNNSNLSSGFLLHFISVLHRCGDTLATLGSFCRFSED